MNFTQFAQELNTHVNTMCAVSPHLYLTDVDTDALWAEYLAAFDAEDNLLYRERTEHDCHSCRRFIKQYGGLVSIDPASYKVRTVWGFVPSERGYRQVVDHLDRMVSKAEVVDKFITKAARLGTELNRVYDKETQDVTTWHHLYIQLPRGMKHIGRATVDTVRGRYRSDKSCLERVLREITPDALGSVRELVEQRTLYKGQEWKSALNSLNVLQAKYSELDTDSKRNNFCWAESGARPAASRIRNTSVGTLLVNLSEGMELERAVAAYEVITAPSNYQRPKALVTKSTLKHARDTIEELGLTESLPRRFAKLDDITVDNVLFANRDARAAMQGSVLDVLEQELDARPKLKDVQPIAWEAFLRDVLPHASSLEALVDDDNISSLVSLLAPVNPDAAKMFKWDNNFCWAYTGNIADSMTQRVKDAGGAVDGALRFSIQWNEGEWNVDDLDAHCTLPSGHEIYYGSKLHAPSSGRLDVDIITPEKGKPAVENITWPSLNRMQDGEYTFRVHCYTDRRGRDGFKAMIATRTERVYFNHPEPLHRGRYVTVATVVKKGDTLTIVPDMESSRESGAERWGLKSGSFHPVQAVMYSPNYWDGQQGVGHQHVMFMIPGCENDETPNGFFNEYLRGELVKHRRVFEVLGSRMSVEPCAEQLSGLGFSLFSANKQRSVTLRVKGRTERLFKVEF